MRLDEAPLRIALVYAIAGAVWIVLGGWLLLRIAPETSLLGQAVKGIVFVLLSATLIFVLGRGELRQRERLQLERETLGSHSARPHVDQHAQD